MSKLMSPATLRGLTLRNRTVVAPMCQYSSIDGFANDWHFVHLGRFGIGGFGLVIFEATGVVPEGRISYADMGLWKDEHIAPLARIVDFLHSQNTAAGIQLAHAGRKASTSVPWISMVPFSMRSSWFTQRISVDFPEPEGPHRMMRSPWCTSRSMFFRAW